MSQRDFDRGFQQRLRALRLHLELTQEEMADALGIASADTYSKYERRSMLPIYFLPRLALLTGASLDWIVTGRGTTTLRRIETRNQR